MSKGLRKLLIALLVVAGLGYLGAKLYLHNEAEIALRELSYAARDVVRYDYESLSAGLDGSISIDALTLRPSNSQGEIFVRNLTIQAGSLPSLFSVREALADGRLPNELQVTVKDLRLNFNSALYRKLDSLSGGLLIGTPFDHLACGALKRLGGDELEDMGYPYLATDARVSVTRGRDERAALLSVEMEAPDLARFKGEAVLRSPEGAITLDTLNALDAGLEDADLRYRDQGYFDARNYYCAAQRDETVADYLDVHMDTVETYLRQRGAVPSKALIEAYRRLVSSPGNELHVAFQPREPLPLAQLGKLKPEQLISSLNPMASVNGDSVEDLAIEWVEPDDAFADSNGNGSSPQSAQYFPAAPEALLELIGSYARLVSYDGTTYEGLIQDTSGSRVTLQRRFQGGNMSFDVRVADIKSAEIYRQSPLPPAMQPKPADASQEPPDTYEPEMVEDPAGSFSASPPDEPEGPPPETPPTQAEPTQDPAAEDSTPSREDSSAEQTPEASEPLN